MARKEKRITIDKGRDKGKQFLVTEMPIMQADQWAQKALFSVAKGGLMGNVSEGAGMMDIGVLIEAVGSIEHSVGIELMNELFDCVQAIPSGGTLREFDPSIDVEDLSTLWTLRKEALMIHIDFLAQGDPQSLIE